MTGGSIALGAYLLVVNVIAFAMYGVDKGRAVRNEWRIPEKTLIGIAVIGGSLGALAGMRIFHHKTRKPAFYFGVPLILVIQLAVAAYLGLR